MLMRWIWIAFVALSCLTNGFVPDTCTDNEKQMCSSSVQSPSVPVTVEYDQHALFFDFANIKMPESYVFRHVPDFLVKYDWEALWLALGKALRETWNCTYAWIQFYRLALLLLKEASLMILDALLPHIQTLALVVSDCLRKLEWYYQVALVLSATLIIVAIRKGYVRRARLWYFCFVQTCRHRYRNFLASLSTQTRRLMLLLPHVIWILSSLCIQAYAPTSAWTSCFRNELLTNILIVLYPVYRSIRSVRQHRVREAKLNAQKIKSIPRTRGNVAPSSKSRDDAPPKKDFEYILRFWVVWSFAICVSSIATLFIPNFLSNYAKVSNFWVNMILLWLQLPITRGDSVVYSTLRSIIHPRNVKPSYDPSRDRPAESDSERRQILRSLMRLSIVPERYVTLMTELWSQGPLLISLVFFFTPGFLTSRGCYLFAFGFPAYIIINSLHANKSHTYEWWVCYYSVSASFEYVYFTVAQAISWMPFFYHLKLLIFLWLEFPYFKGGERIFESFYSLVFFNSPPP